MTFSLNRLINNLHFIISIIMRVVSVSSITYLVLQKWQNWPENLQCPQKSNHRRFSMVKDIIKELKGYTGPGTSPWNRSLVGPCVRIFRSESDPWTSVSWIKWTFTKYRYIYLFILHAFISIPRRISHYFLGNLNSREKLTWNSG